MRNCCIIGGAGIAEYFELPSDCFVIAADSGIRHLSGFGVLPDLIVGDFDSFSSDIDYDCEILRYPPEKDDTDLMIAVKKAVSLGFERIFLVGVIGGRFDHTVASLQTLEYISEHSAEGIILDKSCAAFIANRGKHRYKADKDCYFSVFSLTDESEVTLRGVKYELTRHKLSRSFPLGVSNEFISDYAEVEVLKGKLLIIYAKR